jgi:hypothetical protein
MTTTSISTGNTMSNMSQAFPSSFELWEFVSAFEDGSLPLAACTDDAVAAIAVWYLSMLSPSDAMQRLADGLRRNHLRFAARSVVSGDGDRAFADVWASVLQRILALFGARDPVAVANWLMRVPAIQERQAA